MLRPEMDAQIPAETIKVAKADFPNGNIYLTLRDTLGTVFQDENFKSTPRWDNLQKVQDG
jgi:transposase